MTQISSYYASVGVKFDNTAIKGIQTYLNKIKNQLKSFQDSVDKNNAIHLRVVLNTKGLTQKLRTNLKSISDRNVLRVKTSLDTSSVAGSLKNLSNKSAIRISQFKVNKSALNKAINSQDTTGTLKKTLITATVNAFKVDKVALNKAVKGVAVGGILLSSFKVDRKSLTDTINKSMGAKAGVSGRTPFRVGARLSQDSLTAMRDQIRRSLSEITIRPTINASVNARQRGGGTQSSGQSRSGGMSPFQHSFGPRGINPFIFGGMAGGMIRYGAFALPGVAGVLGLNALTNTATEMQSQRMALSMTAGDGVGKDGTIRSGDYYYDYLDKLGERVGKKTTDLMPDFTQMLAAARGTALEDQLESSFAGLVQYGSVMGLSDDQMKRSTRA